MERGELRYGQGEYGADDYQEVEDVPAILKVGHSVSDQFDDGLDREDDGEEDVDPVVDESEPVRLIIESSCEYHCVYDDESHDYIVERRVLDYDDGEVS